ncbi:hypothetical protein AYO40_01815 [Planctomycetaceae bacterium SCGC AG-212-D15]|nr:hypothetical protein AYO40_01815 [Planctomycetaceae bacterium SCGC AG-212-D15]
MFRPEEIQARLREKPFRPFRIIASEGQRVDVRHPDLVLVGVRDMMIGFPGPENPTAYDRITRLALVHLVALEDLPMVAAPGNGQE